MVFKKKIILLVFLFNQNLSKAQSSIKIDIEIQRIHTYKGTINNVPKLIEINFTNFNTNCDKNLKEGVLSIFEIKAGKKITEKDKSKPEIPFLWKNDSLRLLTYSSNQKLKCNESSIVGTIVDSKISKTYNFKSVTRNGDVADCFSLTTKDTSGTNRFSDDTICVSIYKSLKIFKGKRIFQEIRNINEETFSMPKNNKRSYYIKLEDFNNDNYLDIILTYSPQTRLYETDDVIFLFDSKSMKFSSKKIYRLRNLSDQQLKKLYSPGTQ